MDEKKILHVDSDDLLRDQVSAYLTKEGHDIAGSGSVEAALEILLEQQIHATVLEIGLAGSVGMNALIQIRRHTDGPIVIMSNWGQLTIRLQCLQNGANYYLVKPTPLQELSAVLNTFFRTTITNNETKWQMNSAMQSLIGANGHWMYLTAEEWIFIKTVRLKIGIVVNRETLTNELGKNALNYNPRCMNNILRRLRVKAKNAGLGELPLRTRHGLGYIWIE